MFSFFSSSRPLLLLTIYSVAVLQLGVLAVPTEKQPYEVVLPSKRPWDGGAVMSTGNVEVERRLKEQRTVVPKAVTDSVVDLLDASRSQLGTVTASPVPRQTDSQDKDHDSAEDKLIPGPGDGLTKRPSALRILIYSMTAIFAMWSMYYFISGRGSSSSPKYTLLPGSVASMLHSIPTPSLPSIPYTKVTKIISHPLRGGSKKFRVKESRLVRWAQEFSPTGYQEAPTDESVEIEDDFMVNGSSSKGRYHAREEDDDVLWSLDDGEGIPLKVGPVHGARRNGLATGGGWGGIVDYGTSNHI